MSMKTFISIYSSNTLDAGSITDIRTFNVLARKLWFPTLLCKWTAVTNVSYSPTCRMINQNTWITCILIEFCDLGWHEPNGLQLCDMTVCAEADAAESYWLLSCNQTLRLIRRAIICTQPLMLGSSKIPREIPSHSKQCHTPYHHTWHSETQPSSTWN